MALDLHPGRCFDVSSSNVNTQCPKTFNLGLCLFVSRIFFFLIPGFPEEAKWLTQDERAYIKARLQQDQGRSAAERQIRFKDVVTIFKDYKILVGGFMYFGRGK